MLTQVADGVWVRQSEWVWTNSIVVRGEDGLILVDPGIDGSELEQLADDLDRLGVPAVAGFSTHPHWDHLLWHARFGDVPRYATPAGANAAVDARERAQAMAAESASGIPLELIALVTPLPADGGPVPGEIIEHQAHAVGHATVLLADRGVLLAGDMLSDVLIPLLDARRPDQVGAYETALDRLEEAARHVDVLVPGHGAVAEGPEVAARLAADRAYIDALRRGEDRSTRVWGRMRTGSPAPTGRTWSRPEGGRGLLMARGSQSPRFARAFDGDLFGRVPLSICRLRSENPHFAGVVGL
jgi:glyoxylase-like metal-dependent hydrolase (beta-lactamase superfamily II)